MKIKSFVAFFILIFVGNAMAQGPYVKINCNSFELDGVPYRPLVANYLFDFTKNYNTETYYLSPAWNYSDLWGYPNTGGPGRFMYSWTDDEGVALIKAQSDMAKIKAMGFNTIRIFTAPLNDNGTLKIPTGAYSSFFAIVDQLLGFASSQQLKAIICVSPPKAWEIHESYKTFLEVIAKHFKNNSTVLAYDLYNEPFYAFQVNDVNDKYKISNWVSEWCYTLKQFDPNHLITIGLTHPETVINWDPLVMPIDFVSFHFYEYTENLQQSEDTIRSYLYWSAKTIKMPWIIGETGYGGTDEAINDPQGLVGSEVDQADFAYTTLLESLNCSCRGYSWWQYQEINWQLPLEDHQGLINNFGQFDGFANETYKLAAEPFGSYAVMSVNPANCIKPLNYYNIHNYSSLQLTGTVRDNNGSPLANAVVVGWKQIGNTYPNYITYTDDNGNFSLYTDTPNYSFYMMWISLPGYSALKINSPSATGLYKIQQINKNEWTKKWTNDANGKIDLWVIHDSDKFYTGDFDGDGQDELLCVANTGSANDLMMMFHYNNSNADWELEWTNAGNPLAGDGIYPYRANLIVGDFDGDGRDDLLGASGNWMTSFSFGEDGNWHWWQSNYGYINNPLYPLSFVKPYAGYLASGDFDGDGRSDLLGSVPGGWTTWFKFDATNQWAWQQSDYGFVNNPLFPMSFMGPYHNFIVGDFDGDGKDEVLGNALPNGWMTLFGLEAGQWQWSWSDYGHDLIGMRPYRNQLIAGNFDVDRKDELLGFSTWATKFDFESSGFAWTWSTYSSGIFSDWPTISLSTTPTKYFFIQTHAYSPEQLMAIRKIGSTRLSSMYSFNKDLECPTH